MTRLAAFSSSDEAVATVDGDGLVVGLERGEAAILVRYLEQMETLSLTFLKDMPGFSWPNPPENNFVDHFVFEKLRQLQIVPSQLCTDEEFVRRCILDVIGAAADRRRDRSLPGRHQTGEARELIAALLERPEYAEFWALKWADLLRLRNGKMTAAGVHKFHRWLVRAMRATCLTTSSPARCSRPTAARSAIRRPTTIAPPPTRTTAPR